MACCLSQGCCPTRRPPNNSRRRTKREPGNSVAPAKNSVFATTAITTSSSCECRPQQPSPALDSAKQRQYCGQTDVNIIESCARDSEPEVRSLAPPTIDFMAMFFKNCEQIVRDNEVTLQSALRLDSPRGDCLTTPVSDRRRLFDQRHSQKSDALSSSPGANTTFIATTLKSHAGRSVSTQPFSVIPVARDKPRQIASFVLPGDKQEHHESMSEQYDHNGVDVASIASLGGFSGNSVSSVVDSCDRPHRPKVTVAVAVEIPEPIVAPANSPVTSSLATLSSHSRDGRVDRAPGSVTLCRRRPSVHGECSSSRSKTPTSRRCCKHSYSPSPASRPRRPLLPHHPGLGSRPPCLGQECSPIRTTPCGGTAIEPAADIYVTPHQLYQMRLCPDTALEREVTLDQPTPAVVQRSCQKVDRWLRRIHEERPFPVGMTPVGSSVTQLRCNSMKLKRKSCGGAIEPSALIKVKVHEGDAIDIMKRQQQRRRTTTCHNQKLVCRRPRHVTSLRHNVADSSRSATISSGWIADQSSSASPGEQLSQLFPVVPRDITSPSLASCNRTGMSARWRQRQSLLRRMHDGVKRASIEEYSRRKVKTLAVL